MLAFTAQNNHTVQGNKMMKPLLTAELLKTRDSRGQMNSAMYGESDYSLPEDVSARGELADTSSD